MEQHYKRKKLILGIITLCGLIVGLSGSGAMLMVILEKSELYVGVTISIINNFALVSIISTHNKIKEEL